MAREKRKSSTKNKKDGKEGGTVNKLPHKKEVSKKKTTVPQSLGKEESRWGKRGHFEVETTKKHLLGIFSIASKKPTGGGRGKLVLRDQTGTWTAGVLTTVAVGGEDGGKKKRIMAL